MRLDESGRKQGGGCSAHGWAWHLLVLHVVETLKFALNKSDLLKLVAPSPSSFGASSMFCLPSILVGFPDDDWTGNIDIGRRLDKLQDSRSRSSVFI